MAPFGPGGAWPVHDPRRPHSGTTAMSENLERLRGLLAEGYRIEDIASDAWEIEVTLVRGDATVSVTLGRDEAAELLAVH